MLTQKKNIMKVNKVLSYLNDILNSNDQKVQLNCIYCIVIIGALLNFILIGWEVFPDSQRYVDGLAIFFSGSIDGIRSAYPFFFWCIKIIIGSIHLYWGIVVVQNIVFLIFAQLLNAFGVENGT